MSCRPVLLEGYCFCATCVQTLFWTRHGWLLCNALCDLEFTKFLVVGYLFLVETLPFIAVHIQLSLMDLFVQWVLGLDTCSVIHPRYKGLFLSFLLPWETPHIQDSNTGIAIKSTPRPLPATSLFFSLVLAEQTALLLLLRTYTEALNPVSNCYNPISVE